MWDYGGHMGWMWLWWIVGLALLVAVIWAVARAATPQRPADGIRCERACRGGRPAWLQFIAERPEQGERSGS